MVFSPTAKFGRLENRNANIHTKACSVIPHNAVWISKLHSFIFLHSLFFSAQWLSLTVWRAGMQMICIASPLHCCFRGDALRNNQTGHSRHPSTRRPKRQCDALWCHQTYSAVSSLARDIRSEPRAGFSSHRVPIILSYITNKTYEEYFKA